MKYLVTGGAGFIGSHLVEKLQDLGHNVVILDNFDEIFSYPKNVKVENIRNFDRLNGDLVVGNIRNGELLDKLFEVKNFDGVFHLAAKAGVRYSIKAPIHYFNVNTIGTINLIKACVKYNVPKFVFASSSSVYGERNLVFKNQTNVPGMPFMESDPTNFPMSPYAASKISAELALATFRKNMLGITCLRFFNVYGPRMRPDTALHKFAIQIRGGKPITKYGDGSTYRDYTYVTDIVSGMIRAIGIPGYNIINLGGGKPVRLNDLIKCIRYAVYDCRFDAITHPIKTLPTQLGDVPYTYSDIKKAKLLLNWEPKVTWEEGVGNFVKWFKDKT